MLGRLLRRRSRTSRNSTHYRESSRSRLSVESLEARTLLSGPEIAVLNGAAEIESGNVTPVEFGIAAQGTAGPTRTFTIRNDGDASLSIGQTNLPAGFSLVEGLYPNIAVRGSDTITVRLDSTTLGTKTGQISITNDDDDENPYVLNVTGIVAAGGPEISVLLGNTVVVDGTTTPIEFGTVVQGQTGPTRSFTVRNDGTQSLALSSISLPTGFILTDGLSSSLAPLTSDTFSVQLSSAAAGTKTGQISITTNDGDENPFNFAIQGTVATNLFPEITVLDGLTVIIDGAVTPIDFGTVFRSQAAPTRTFTVRNDGNGPLALGNITIPAGFSLLDGLATSLVPRGSDTFTIQLDATTVGSPTGQVSIGNSDEDESLFNFTIAGTVLAAAPEIAVVREDFVDLVDGVTPAAVFENVVRGQTGGTWTFTVFNLGTQSLTLAPIVLPAGFTLVDGLPTSLAPGKSNSFTVRLNSATAGDKAGDIVLSNNDADENPFTIAVAGTVLLPGPEIIVQQGSTDIVDDGATPLEFGTGVQRVTGPRQTFTVRNEGTSTLTLGAVSLPAGFALFEGLTSTLAPKATDSFTVRLDTTVIGTFAGNISFATNDADETSFNFPIIATVTPQPVPEITILNGDVQLTNGGAVAIDFGVVVRRTTPPTRTFTIRNDGNETLNLGRIELPNGFSLIKGLRRSIAPRGSDTITIRLDTKKLGPKAGQLVIESNDSDEPAFLIAIIGSVIA